MTNPDYTHAVLIVDRSGSMDNVREEAQKGINSFLRAQRKEPGTFTFTLTQFDTEIETVVRMHAKGKKYTLEPRGGTALFDAVGQEVMATGRDLAALDEDDRPGRVVVLIVTDGEENSSREFSLDQVRDMLAHQRDVYNWQVQFIGAGDAAWQGQQLGVNSTRYADSGEGVAVMYGAMTRSVSAFRAAPAHAAVFNMEADLSETGE